MRISDWISDVCSSDLIAVRQVAVREELGERLPRPAAEILEAHRLHGGPQCGVGRQPVGQMVVQARPVERPAAHLLRSEEHTSELQSLMRTSYAVFCLKKKNKKNASGNLKSTNQNPRHN